MNQNLNTPWDTILNNFNQGKTMMDDMVKWMNESFSYFDELTEMSKNLFDINKTESGYMDFWKNVTDNLQSSVNECMGIWGVTKKDEYETLLNKYESTKKKYEEQAAKISEQAKKITSQTKTLSTQKKKVTELNKAIATHKEEIEAQQKIIEDLKQSAKKEKMAPAGKAAANP